MTILRCCMVSLPFRLSWPLLFPTWAPPSAHWAESGTAGRPRWPRPHAEWTHPSFGAFYRCDAASCHGLEPWVDYPLKNGFPFWRIAMNSCRIYHICHGAKLKRYMSTCCNYHYYTEVKSKMQKKKKHTNHSWPLIVLGNATATLRPLHFRSFRMVFHRTNANNSCHNWHNVAVSHTVKSDPLHFFSK